MEARHGVKNWGQTIVHKRPELARRRSCPVFEFRSTAVSLADKSAERSATREQCGCTGAISLISPAFTSQLSTGSGVIHIGNGAVALGLFSVTVRAQLHRFYLWGLLANDINPPLATHQLPSLPLDSKMNKVGALDD